MSPPAKFHLTATPLARGTNLIEASAGTGKTYAITALFVRLIVEENLTVDQILVVTYTDAATEELRRRVRQALAEALRAFASGASETEYLRELVKKYRNQSREMAARLQNGLWSFDQAPIYTIHGFCQRTLRDRAFESGILFDTELVTNPAELLGEVADDFWRIHFYAAGETVVRFALKNKFGPDRFLGLLKSCVNHPTLEFLSPAQGKALPELSAELEAGFEQARACWRSEREAIQSGFGSSQAWCNSPYNNDASVADMFEALDDCFAGSRSAFEALDTLKNFCTDSLAAKRSLRSKAPTPAHRFFGFCDRVCAAEKMWLAGVQLAFLDYARTELPRRKAERKIQHFDDLLTRLHDALCGPAGPALAEELRTRYRAALIDEFQDTDPVQYRIFRTAFGTGKTFLFLIGDPKQAIYGFRGADIFTYLEAAGEARRQFTLGENWRSESRLVEAVNTLFSAGADPFVVERIRFHAVAPRGLADAEPLTIEGTRPEPLQFWFWPRKDGKKISKGAAGELLPPLVAGEIARLLNGETRIGGRKLRPEDIAVLVLENRQAAAMQQALRAVRVPSVLHTTASLFASAEAAELRRVLTGVALPGDERLVRSALATELFGVTGEQLAATTEPQWQAWLETFHEYLELWNRHGFFRMFRAWLQKHQVRGRLLAFADGERRLTNLLHLGEVLHQAETERRLGATGLLKWFSDQMSAEGEPPEEHQLRLETDDNAVRLVTVHKSKGLEYAVVFCLFSWKDSELKRGHEEQVFFHDPGRGHRLVRDLGPEIAERHRNLAQEEKLAENVRLLYVALTRAKHRCYFVWGAVNGAETSAPAWLFHRPMQRDAPALVPALTQHFKDRTDEQLLNDLDTLKAASSNAIGVATLPDLSTEPFLPPPVAGPQSQCREFQGRIQRDWLISSFTFFHAGRPTEAPDRDSAAAAREEDSPAAGIFGFPRGARAGTCLHDILERLDFQATEPAISPLVNDRLQAHGLWSAENVQSVSRMLCSVLAMPLAPAQPGFSLSRVARAERLTELEFYFPVRNVSAGALHQLLGNFGWATTRNDLDRLAFDAVTGFLKGYIDLVFRFENRFYLVDWKSNWLGNAPEDYSRAAIREEMRRQDYFLQYHLYTVALHKYLAARFPAYDYERDFGGVLYLFLRGVDPAHPDCGWFHDRPRLEVVTGLTALLRGGRR